MSRETRTYGRPTGAAVAAAAVHDGEPAARLLHSSSSSPSSLPRSAHARVIQDQEYSDVDLHLLALIRRLPSHPLPLCRVIIISLSLSLPPSLPPSLSLSLSPLSLALQVPS
jgi:hypothetical protein